MVRWELPERYRPWSWIGALQFALVLTGIFFIAVWLGLGNCSYPKCWGDPRPFFDAVKRIPMIFVFIVLCQALFIGLEGISQWGSLGIGVS